MGSGTGAGTGASIGSGFDWGQAITIGGGIFSAVNSAQQGKASQQYYEYLAQNVEQQAKAVKSQGDTDLQQLHTQAGLLKESQKAIMAANGIDINSVTAQDISGDTAAQERLDAILLKYNTDINLWSLKEQAKQTRYAGSNAAAAGATQGFSTLLGTAGQVSDMWSRWGKTSAGSKFTPTRPISMPPG
jgi:hypothetical protein